MCPTIRIDDEVYGWLQSQAVPFDDTPNAVLRRMAGLDATKPQRSPTSESSPVPSKNYPGRRRPLARGDGLIKRWNIPALQARLHRDGHWYEHLNRFPAALCDPYGYILFETEQAFRNCKQINLGQQVNVPGGISSIPGYKKVDDPLL